MIPTKQEWRVKKTRVLALIASNNDMDHMDDDESPLIKDGSPPPTDMDINMVFTLPTKFIGAEEEIAQLCLGPKEAMFEKSKELIQHFEPLYIRGHINGRLISRMIVNDAPPST
jgi:hypothetical protein